MIEQKVELLAPAGSKDAFLGAIHAGADAVYLAGNKYGARAYADNFGTEELLYCIRYAHLFGRKVYLTVNTLLKDKEMQELYEYIRPYYEAGLDACIVQDMGVFMFLKKHFPEMELHVSTQMTVTGSYGAQYLKELGASRIVPARELSLEEIKRIKKDSGIEIETFIHGAMCYSYSGQCLFSSILGGRSGNRGRCAQPCRLPYKVHNEKQTVKECYPLSLKDMCTIEHIEDLMKAGIDSFKIEGRMKRPEYAAGVTAVYRKYIDKVMKSPKQNIKIEKHDLEKLQGLYIRSERQDGYYFKHNGAEMVTINNPGYSGSDEQFIDEIREKYIDNKPKLPISIYVVLVCGEKASLTLCCEDVSVTVYGEVVNRANNQPITEDNIKKQICKLGDTVFCAEMMEVYTDGSAFYSLKSLNELRRNAIAALEEQRILALGLCVGRNAENLVNSKYKSIEKPGTNGFSIMVSNFEQLSVVTDFCAHSQMDIARIYLESEMILNETFKVDLPHIPKYISLPYCFRHKDCEKIEKIVAYARKHGYNGFLVRNIEEVAYLKNIDYQGEIIGDASVYVWNQVAYEFWSSQLNGLTCPYELNYHEYSDMLKGHFEEKPVYGRIPMMISANCLQKTTNLCKFTDKQRVISLQDRYQKEFPVYTNCHYCYNVIYNSVPLSLHKELDRMKGDVVKRLTFTVESKRETYDILCFFEKLITDKAAKLPYKDYTTGHENRGVE